MPQASLIRAVTLNHQSFAATMVWIQALLYYGSYRFAGESAKAPPQHLADYTKLVVELDPRFESPYDWFVSTYLATRPKVSSQDLAHVNSVLDVAMTLHPATAKYPYQAGLNYLGYSADRTPQERVLELERGISYLERAAQFDDAPPLTTKLIGYMYQRKAQLDAQLSGKPAPDDRQAQIDFQMSLYQSTLEPEARAQLKQQLIALGVPERVLERQDRELLRPFEQAYEQQRSYLPVDLWVWTQHP